MAGKSASIMIKILSDATGVTKGVGEASGVMGRLGDTMRSALVPATAMLAGVTAGAFALRDAGEAASTSNSRLEQVFKSMGDTTGAAAKEAEKWANILAQQTGIDQNTIKLTQAKLATFGAVSNEVARQAGIFDRATNAAADLAAAGFGTMDANAVQLGKALQDPINGLASLGESGVTFTAEQKAQIKTMVEASDTLGAQKMILAAIETQVQGTAKATANASDQQKVAWSQVTEKLGLELLPLFNKLTEAVIGIVSWVGDHTGLVIGLGAAIGTVAAVVLGVNAAMTAWTAITTAWAAVTKIGAAVQVAFNAVLAANPISLVILAVAALVAGLVWFFTQTELGRGIIAGAWAGIQAAISAVAGWFTGTLVPWVQGAFAAVTDAIAAVVGWVRTNWPLLLAIITGPIGLAVYAIAKNWDAIKAGAAAVVTAIRDRMNDAIGWITSLPGRALGTVSISQSSRAADWIQATSTTAGGAPVVVNLPNEITLTDADGTFIARMRTEALTALDTAAHTAFGDSRRAVAAV